MKPLIIDTDPGLDDALAIMLAVKSGIFDIKAVTTVSGNSTIENTTRNARYLLKLLKREEIPVYSGSEYPLVKPLIQAVVHGESGLAGIDPKNEPVLNGLAVEKILEIVRENQEVTLVTLGPLTNIAKAITKDPECMKKIKEIVIMGGAIKVCGNKNRVAEFNVFVDPEAAEIVFNFPVKKTLVPLDACNKVELQLDDFEQLRESELYSPVMAMMRPYIEGIFKAEGIKAAIMYDPLTVYYLINKEACTIKNYDLRVECKGELTRGMTVPELRLSSQKDENISVVEEINEESFRKDFFDILRG